ncbi:hypothetical protein [Flavicella sp.]|uniref:hypothetical protein n=1 Tax=Flavicella sp. TaxID=2957742 RepID=UPI00301844C7
MKKLFRGFTVVLVVLMSSSIVKAGNNYSIPSLSFKEGNQNTIILKVSALNNAIQVVLQNNEGSLLFTETLEKGYSYRKKYDISDFNDGVYFMKVVEATDVKFFKIVKGEENKISEVDKLPFE